MTALKPASGLRFRLTLLVLIVSVVPLLVLGVLSFQVSQSVVQALSERDVKLILEHERRFVLTVMDDVESLIANVSGQDALKQFLARTTGQMSDYERLSTQARIGYILSGYIELKGLVSIDVFSPSGQTFHVGDTLDLNQTREDLVEALKVRAKESGSTVYWSGVEDNVNDSSSYKKVITAVKRLGENLLVVSYDPALLNQSNRPGATEFSLIVDARQRLVIHPDPARWGQEAPPELLTHLQPADGTFSAVLEGRSYEVRGLPLERGGWTLWHWTSTDTLAGAVAAIGLGTLVTLAVALVLALVFTRLIARQIIAPIRAITEGFQSLQRGVAAERLSSQGRDEIGTLVVWYNSFLDSQDELKELNRTLESRIEAEVAASREKDSLLIEQSRHASMGEMIGNIAHQWRQPLNTAALLVQDLQLDYRDGALTAAGVDVFVEQMLAVIDKMSTTIDDFRDFFRPNRAKVEFALEAEVASALSFVEPAFKSASITVQLELGKGMTVLGYPNELAQVLLNLFNNARDVLAERNPERKVVRVRLERRRGHAQLSVVDSGGGIDEAILPKIFDPYFTTKGPRSGTGIGLFLSRTIVERNLGGSLIVRNLNWGDGLRGAEFVIEL